ncbi:cyclophilin-like fold protein [Corynebacterium mastitidis]|uniref:cyclophilin-like fold protein n=1 Tax=Corynebacterium mastitidis TaxID=161890 RepID=UPI00036CD06D|nr:cyclophilin-like fold protein [Corynebacterium mastitidis]
MILTAGEKRFEVSWEDNLAVRWLARHSPVEVVAEDYAGQEKVGRLHCSLPASVLDSSTPNRVRVGELYLYGDRHVVLFYVSKPNRWGGYTRLGRVREASEVAGLKDSGRLRLGLVARPGGVA